MKKVRNIIDRAITHDDRHAARNDVDEVKKKVDALDPTLYKENSFLSARRAELAELADQMSTQYSTDCSGARHNPPSQSTVHTAAYDIHRKKDEFTQKYDQFVKDTTPTTTVTTTVKTDNPLENTFPPRAVTRTTATQL